MRQPVAALAALLLLPTPSFASGGLSCEIEDRNLKFAAESGVTHGMGGPFINFKASAEILAEGTPEDFRKLTLDGDLVHHWLSGTDLNLSFYRERSNDQPHAYVDLVIETRQEEEGSYKGTYTLSVFIADAPADAENLRNFTGPITCFAE